MAPHHLFKLNLPLLTRDIGISRLVFQTHLLSIEEAHYASPCVVADNGFIAPDYH